MLAAVQASADPGKGSGTSSTTHNAPTTGSSGSPSVTGMPGATRFTPVRPGPATGQALNNPANPPGSRIDTVSWSTTSTTTRLTGAFPITLSVIGRPGETSTTPTLIRRSSTGNNADTARASATLNHSSGTFAPGVGSAQPTSALATQTLAGGGTVPGPVTKQLTVNAKSALTATDTTASTSAASADTAASRTIAVAAAAVANPLATNLGTARHRSRRR